MHSIVAISGSPSPTSKTAMLAEYVLEWACSGGPCRHYRVSAISPQALLAGDMSDPQLSEMADAVRQAHGVIIATPIYKSAYSGLLKIFLDGLPQFALAGAAVLPVATGGSLAHVLALDYALCPVLRSMGARYIVQGYFVSERDMRVENGKLQIEDAAAAPLFEAVRHFRYALDDDPSSRPLGHPRPPQPGASA